MKYQSRFPVCFYVIVGKTDTTSRIIIRRNRIEQFSKNSLNWSDRAIKIGRDAICTQKSADFPKKQIKTAFYTIMKKK